MLNLSNGKNFTIAAEGMSEANRYVGAVFLDGKPLNRGYIRRADIEADGELRFVMQATPNGNWAKAESARPYSMTGYSKR